MSFFAIFLKDPQFSHYTWMFSKVNLSKCHLSMYFFLLKKNNLNIKKKVPNVFGIFSNTKFTPFIALYIFFSFCLDDHSWNLSMHFIFFKLNRYVYAFFVFFMCILRLTWKLVLERLILKIFLKNFKIFLVFVLRVWLGQRPFSLRKNFTYIFRFIG